MALVSKSTGNVIAATDVDQYLNALTGVMTDQPFTHAYSPASSTTTPVLKLNGNGNGPLLQGYNGATQEFQFDQSGNLSMAGALTVNGTGSHTIKGTLTDGSSHDYAIMVATVGTAGRQIFVGTTTPTGANEGDIWIKA